MERRLAAILVADVVGYSGMMERDEAGTFSRLKMYRTELVEPTIATHHGRIFKLTGDGLLAEFGSIVDAVECAASIQRGMAARNLGLAGEQRIDLRIGVHVGDVIVEGEDRHGDAVNVAARLQQLAEPGGVCVSRSVVDHVRQKVTLGFEPRGEERLKNIAEPVSVFRVQLDALPHTMQSAVPHADKPAIAVLPFANMSGDPEQNYFADGITEDIITELSRFHNFAVIARNSSFQYRDRSVDVKRVGHELGANYIVEGSVRRFANRIRITAQLVETRNGSHVWAERYDRELEDIFAIQDDVVKTVVASLAGKVADVGHATARRKRTDNLAAYDYFLRGYELWQFGGDYDPGQAIQMFEHALALDSDFAEAHAGLSMTLTIDYWAKYYRDPLAPEKLDRALRAATRAVALDANDAMCHWALAQVHISRHSFDLADHHLVMATNLNPNDANLMAYRSSFEIFFGRPDAALAWLDRAVQLNPHMPSWYWELRGLALYHLRRYSEAAAAFDHIPIGPAWFVRFRAACYAQLGRLDEARAIAAEALRQDPGFTLRGFAKIEPYKSPADLDHMIDGLRKAGLPQ